MIKILFIILKMSHCFVSESTVYGVKDINKYLDDYHCSELYIEGKTYEINVYCKDYGHGVRMYQNKLVSVNDIDYVCAEEHINKEELEKLMPYCPCVVCTAKWYHITSYFQSPSYVGCLKSYFPCPAYYDTARHAYNKDHPNDF